MIKSLSHCIEVQARRLQYQHYCRVNESHVSNGLYAKAVRRYLKKHHPNDYRERKTEVMRKAWAQSGIEEAV